MTFLLAGGAFANSPNQSSGSSDFLLKDSSGNTTQALTLSAKIDMEINGLLNYTHLTQRFYNSSHDFVAGEYVFPLPDTATVDSLTIKIGSRIIEGVVKEKAQANKIFKQAQKAGRKAALLVQDRPNLFRMGVTNIPPGEVIEVAMSFVNPVEYDQGEYRITFPMTLTPRYSPLSDENGITAREHLNSEYLSNNSFQNPSFMLNHPAGADIKNPIELSLHFNPGFNTKDIVSDSHDIRTNDLNENTKKISFNKRFVPMDRDFQLVWRQANHKLESQIFIESAYQHSDEDSPTEEEHYAMLMLTPWIEENDNDVLAKEVIFIIDTSGSMGGESIRQAKKALMTAVELLNEGDSFNVIEFNSNFSTVFNHSEVFSPDSKRRAMEFIHALKASGGTEMKSALLEALQSPIDEEERLKQIVFITDGAVGNEKELIKTVNQYLGNSRLFSIAIGSAPNQHLFRQVSKVGKGSFVKINNMTQIQDKMKQVFDKISKPAMIDIELIDHTGNILAMAPGSIPDVYFGEPINVMLKLDRPDIDVKIKGKQAGKIFEQRIEVKTTNSKGIAKLWGKAEIEALTDKMTLGQGESSMLKQQIVDLSIKHSILTSYTSFVAVDKVISRQSESQLKTSNVDNLMPKGSRATKTTHYPSTSLNLQSWYALSLIFMLLGFLGLRRKSL